MRIWAAGSCAIALSTVAIVSGCSSSAPSSDEGAADSTSQALIEDIASMTQRADGSFDVVCKNGSREVVTSAQILANQVCSSATQPVRCVRNCAERWGDGSCKNYLADFCGPGATCIQRCTQRWGDGSCKTFEADFCRAGDAVCTQVCAERWGDGSCKSWGADHCGAAAYVCVENCVARWGDGSCKTRGTDFCKEGTPAPVCLENCVARWGDGSCKTWGADNCF